MNSKIAIFDVERFRGETTDYALELNSASVGGVYRLIASSKKDPVDDAKNVFDIIGTLDPDDNARVLFTPTQQDADISAGVYYLFAWETFSGVSRVVSRASLIVRNAPPVV